MNFHVIAVEEAYHINARHLVDAYRGIAFKGDVLHNAAHHVDNLQGGFTNVADLPFAAVEVGKVGIVFDVVVSVKHQAEARSVVAGGSLEGVARGLEQVDIGAGHIVDEVEVVHLDILGVNADGIGAVLFGLEVDGHLAFGGAANDGVVAVALRDIELGAVLEELELRQLLAFTKADDGAVDDGATVAGDVDHHLLDSLAVVLGAEGDGLTIAFGWRLWQTGYR